MICTTNPKNYKICNFSCNCIPTGHLKNHMKTWQVSSFDKSIFEMKTSHHMFNGQIEKIMEPDLTFLLLNHCATSIHGSFIAVRNIYVSTFKIKISDCIFIRAKQKALNKEKQQPVLTSVQLWSRFLAWQGCVGTVAGPWVGQEKSGQEGFLVEGKKCRTQVAVGISRASWPFSRAGLGAPPTETHPLASDAAHELPSKKSPINGGLCCP